MQAQRALPCAGHGWLAAMAFATIAADSMTAANYVIFSQRFSADPAPIVHDGRVYLYTSHDKDQPHGYDMQDWNCLSSSDMTNWRDEGIAFSLKNTTWAQDLHAWAQQVVALKNGSFVMYFPAMGSGGGVGVATASHPTGPFEQATDGPVVLFFSFVLGSPHVTPYVAMGCADTVYIFKTTTGDWPSTCTRPTTCCCSLSQAAERHGRRGRPHGLCRR